MRDETAATAENIHGDKLYQQRARVALPILVRQARAEQSIYYEDLANELGMSNPRNLNYVLGSVGRSIMELEKKWKLSIPPIQCLVINQTEELPGEGFGWFKLGDVDWKTLNRRQKRTLVQATLQQIFAYSKWGEVLTALELKPLVTSFDEVTRRAAQYQVGGESEDHRRLKTYVQTHPEVVRVPSRHAPGVVEKRLPSADCMDVFFDCGSRWLGVEVKSARSPVDDIVRGLFQCVKYHALLKAMAALEQRDIEVDTVLVLEAGFPVPLTSLKNILGVQVVDNVRPVPGDRDESPVTG